MNRLLKVILPPLARARAHQSAPGKFKAAIARELAASDEAMRSSLASEQSRQGLLAAHALGEDQAFGFLSGKLMKEMGELFSRISQPGFAGTPGPSDAQRIARAQVIEFISSVHPSLGLLASPIDEAVDPRAARATGLERTRQLVAAAATPGQWSEFLASHRPGFASSQGRIDALVDRTFAQHGPSLVERMTRKARMG